MRKVRTTSSLILAAALAAVPASAGTISIAWDPVVDSDLVGYRIFWGAGAGQYTQQQDVGLVSGAVLSGLADCTVQHVAVKARDAAGNLSAAYSTEIVGYPRPVVSSVAPASAEQGLQLDLVITGTNFMSGAGVQIGNPSITVNSVTVSSCTQLTANVTIGASAATGSTSLDVTNSDQVFGSSTGLFTIQAAVPPSVIATSPASLTTGVPLDVRPTVSFSEAMKASTISAATVRLLDPSGAALAQAAGSPALSSDGKIATIVPAASLEFAKTYRVQVVGAASGVRDLANNTMLATFTQGSGFTTVTDTSAPAISALAASAQATTATITWTTSEPTDGQVLYRRSRDVSYQQTLVDPTLATSHSVQLQGLAPSTAYSFYVQSGDAAGNRATSSPDATFTTASSSYTYLTIEAESGALAVPLRSTAGAGAFRGAWIDTPSGTTAGTASSPAGRAELGFHVPAGGTWYFWVRLHGPTASSDSWFESVDGAPRQAIQPEAPGVWKWTAARSYSLTAGLHTLELGGREAQARADRVLITNDATFVPTEQPLDDTTPPAAPSALVGSAGTGQATLGWTNPASDLAAIVIRYRTDGRTPASPADGFPVVSRAATAGAADSYTHTGLTNGTIYTYGVFAVDASGNASRAATVQVTPIDITPPPAVGNAWRTDRR